MDKFYLEEHLKQIRYIEKGGDDFEELCSKISLELRNEWKNSIEDGKDVLERQKKAIIGYEKEELYFRNKIQELIIRLGVEKTPYPEWYESLEHGIFHELWGLAGMAEWFLPKFRESSSAKIIGNKIFFLEEGKMVCKKQKISAERRNQLIRSFLLLTPEERFDKDFHEVYLLDGTRITIFRNKMVKKGHEVIIFRRYIVPSYTFEEQVKRGTIPQNAVGLFKAMVSAGYNVAFLGAVRTSKTTFLSTWQSYEDRRLEGVLVETDPEIPLHVLMPEAPIVQIIADGEKLETITKHILRSDLDYLIFAESRDGIACDVVVKVASKGTKRMKITFHSRNPKEFPYDAGAEIVKVYGGDIEYHAKRIAGSFDYLFHFIQLDDKRQKRLKSISEMSCDDGVIKIETICEYDFESDSWNWIKPFSDRKLSLAREENPVAYKNLLEEMEVLFDNK